MTAVLLPNGRQQYFTTPGVPAVGYKLATFAAGTSTPQTTWSDSAQIGANTNPIILDARGEAVVFWAGNYKVQLQDSTGVPIWTVDNVTSIPIATSNFIPSQDNTYTLGSAAFSFANLYLGAGDATALDTVTGNIGYIARTAAEIAASVTPTNFTYQPGDIRRYGAAVNGVTDDLAAINNAILVASQSVVGGGIATAPSGTIFHSAAITMKPFVQLRGAGKFATTFLSTHVGNGIATTSAINASTGVGTEIRDCRFKNTNAANTGGGVVDVGGTEVLVRNVGILGFAYGVIFDQTELGDIDLCDIQQFLTGGVWLVNGADHTPLANAGFTNRISVQRCQFNGDAGASFAAQGIAIVDDGGTQHTFRNNNYNLCVNHFRIASARVVKIEDSEMESNTAVCIVFATTTSVLGTSVGGSSTVVIDNNYIQPGTSVCTMTSAVATITVTNNRFITSAPTFIGTSTVGVVVAYGNFDSNVGTIFDGLAVSHFEMELAAGLATLKATNVSLRGQVTMSNPQVSGWGTPTGAALVNNYPGATATLVQTSNVVAELIIALKNFGLFGA